MNNMLIIVDNLCYGKAREEPEMKFPKNTSLNVAVIQTRSQLGKIEENLTNAFRWAAQAAEKGAQLVLLPELMPSGYTINPKVWRFAEPPHGKTCRWLQDTARQLNLYIGTKWRSKYLDLK